MAGGLVGLLDDIAALAKLAAASVDDVGAAAGRASLKTAGVVVDDAAVTPAYVRGLAAKRELPIIGLLGGFQQLAIANPAFRGLKGGIPYDDLTNLEAHQHPQQFYWDRPEAHGVSQEELDRLIPTPGPPPTPIGR